MTLLFDLFLDGKRLNHSESIIIEFDGTVRWKKECTGQFRQEGNRSVIKFDDGDELEHDPLK